MKPDGHKPWTEQEVAILRTLYATTGAKTIAETLGRSIPSVEGKVSKLGIKGAGRGKRKGECTMHQRLITIVRDAGSMGITTDQIWEERAHYFKNNNRVFQSILYRCVSLGELVTDGQRRNCRVRIAPPGTTPPPRTTKVKTWTEEEHALMREKYAELGRERMAALLHRTIRGVGRKATEMGLRTKHGNAFRPKKDKPEPRKKAAAAKAKNAVARAGAAPTVTVAKRGPFDESIPVTYHPNFKFTSKAAPPQPLRTNTHSVF